MLFRIVSFLFALLLPLCVVAGEQSGTPVDGGALSAPSTETPADTSVGAHGLRLPMVFQGTVRTRDRSDTWHLALLPDQSFRLARTFGEGGAKTRRRDSLGRWRADPTRNMLILRDGAEMPLSVKVTAKGDLQVIDSNTSDASEGLLVPVDTVASVDLNDMFLAGMMTYMADAAIIEECLSGTRFRVAQEGDYRALETAYLADRPGPGEPLYVMLEGGIAMREGMEGPARQTIIVDRFIRTRPGITCERQLADAALRNTYWRIDQLDGEPFPIMPGLREPHMVLEANNAGNYRASLGCNRMRGSFTLEGGNLSFSPAASTMMACPDPINSLEQQFGLILSKVTGYAIEGETLILRDGDGQPRAIFTAVYF